MEWGSPDWSCFLGFSWGILIGSSEHSITESVQLWYLWILLKLVCRLSLQLSAAGSCSRCTLLTPSWTLYFLFSFVIPPENTIALYTDDCKTSSIIDNPEDHVSFEYDHLCSWSQLNCMGFHINKCKLEDIWGKKQPLDANVLLYEPSLDIVLEFKDLGLLVSYNLSWNSHINHIVSSAIRMLGLILCKGLFFM